jgi:hypothetical protein
MSRSIWGWPSKVNGKTTECTSVSEVPFSARTQSHGTVTRQQTGRQGIVVRFPTDNGISFLRAVQNGSWAHQLKWYRMKCQRMVKRSVHETDCLLQISRLRMRGAKLPMSHTSTFHNVELRTARIFYSRPESVVLYHSFFTQKILEVAFLPWTWR